MGGLFFLILAVGLVSFRPIHPMDKRKHHYFRVIPAGDLNNGATPLQGRHLELGSSRDLLYGEFFGYLSRIKIDSGGP